MTENAATTTTPQEEKLVGYKEVADALGISKHAVYRQMQRRKIPYFKFGQSVRFQLSDVRAKIESSCQVAAQPVRR